MLLLCQTFIKKWTKRHCQTFVCPLLYLDTPNGLLVESKHRVKFPFPLILKINHQKQTRRALQTESSTFSLTTEFLNLHAAFLYCMSAEKLLAEVLFRTKCSGFYFSTFLFVV